MTAAIPIKRRMFKILLPITFPSSMSVFPERIEERETANSGAPVPKAIIVRPINSLLTLKFEAVEEAPEIRTSAPLMRKIKPMIKRKLSKIMSICLF